MGDAVMAAHSWLERKEPVMESVSTFVGVMRLTPLQPLTNSGKMSGDVPSSISKKFDMREMLTGSSFLLSSLAAASDHGSDCFHGSSSVASLFMMSVALGLVLALSSRSSTSRTFVPTICLSKAQGSNEEYTEDSWSGVTTWRMECTLSSSLSSGTPLLVRCCLSLLTSAVA